MAKRATKKAVRPSPKKVSAARRQSSVLVGPAEAGALVDVDVSALVRDLGAMIEEARKQVAVVANTSLVTLHWQVGVRVHRKVLEERRGAYGARIVPEAGRQLAARYGNGFNEKSLRHMIRFAQAFPDPEIVSALRRQLAWTHFKQLSYINDELKRSFYAEMCRIEGCGFSHSATGRFSFPATA